VGIYAVPISLLLFGVIVCVETLRQKPRCRIDFLLPVSVMFIVLFCVIPLYLLFFYFSKNAGAGFWIFKNSLDDVVFLVASLASLSGYLAIIFGYYFKNILHRGRGVGRCSDVTINSVEKKIEIKNKNLLIIGIILGCLGSIALFFYAYSIGGVAIMIELAAAFRGSEPPVISRFAFLKNVAPLVIVSSYFFFAIIKSSSTRMMLFFSRVFFVITFFLSLIILFHQSGRLYLITYLFIFPIAQMMRDNKLNYKLIIVGSILFFLFILLGKEGFHFFIDPDSFFDKADTFSSNPISIVSNMLNEFTFPYVTLANTIKVVPVDIMYRWFMDIPISVVYLLPQRLLDLKDLPPTVTMLNVEQFGAPIPVDLLSFSYFSMGFPGVLIVCFVYGFMLRVFDRMLPSNGEYIFVIFRAAWIMFFATNVMYGNPHHALVGGFSLFIATAILLFISRRRSLL